jgi:hypothetical protein
MKKLKRNKRMKKVENLNYRLNYPKYLALKNNYNFKIFSNIINNLFPKILQ